MDRGAWWATVHGVYMQLGRDTNKKKKIIKADGREWGEWGVKCFMGTKYQFGKTKKF